ncbi:MAG: hypothetical protein VYE22_06315 [Myxococcota bacterium]|nr:hypothetical protein [Myxococcota bacterium]
MRERFAHLEGRYWVAAPSTEAERGRLAEMIGHPIPDAIWEVVRGLGGMELRSCFVEIEGAYRDRDEARRLDLGRFYVASTILDLLHRAPKDVDPAYHPLPHGLPYGEAGGSQLWTPLGGPLEGAVLYHSARTGPDSVGYVLGPESARRVGEAVRAYGPEWRYVWPIARSIDELIERIRFRPTPRFESARVREIARAVMKGAECTMTEVAGRSAARLTVSFAASTGRQISVLDDDEAARLEAFLAWHRDYAEDDGAELPSFVGPRGIEERYIGRPPATREILDAVSDALAGEPIARLEARLQAEAQAAVIWLIHLDGAARRVGRVVLFEGARARFRGRPLEDDVEGDEGRAERLHDAPAAFADLMMSGTVAQAVRSASERERAFRCVVVGDDGTEVVLPPPR